MQRNQAIVKSSPAEGRDEGAPGPRRRKGSCERDQVGESEKRLEGWTRLEPGGHLIPEPAGNECRAH